MYSIYSKLPQPTAQKTVRFAVIAWNHTVAAYGVICCISKNKVMYSSNR